MLPKSVAILTLLWVGLCVLVEARTPYPKRTLAEQVLPKKHPLNSDRGSISPEDRNFLLPSEHHPTFSAEGGTFLNPRGHLLPFPPEGRTFPLQSEQNSPASPDGETFPFQSEQLFPFSPEGRTFPLQSEQNSPASPDGGTFLKSSEQFMPLPPEGRTFGLQSEQYHPASSMGGTFPMPSEEIPLAEVNKDDKVSILIPRKIKHSFKDEPTKRHTRLPTSNRRATAAASSPHQEFRTPMSSSSSFECGRINTRIVNGQEAGVHKYPWMVETIMAWKNGKTYTCGGSIFHPQWILTAAHCIEEFIEAPFESFDIYVTVGAHNIEDLEHQGGYTVEVDFPLMHSWYKEIGFPFDIALYKLKLPLVFTQTVAPICLAPSSWKEQDLEGVNLTIAGWGKTETGEFANNLLEMTTLGYNYDKCSWLYEEAMPPKWKTNQICTQKLTGHGDSGGPVMYLKEGRALQVGIVSFGCDNCEGPDVHIRVATFLDWIKSVIKEES